MKAIETERLVLRHFGLQDAADLFDYLHRPVSSCFLSMALTDIRAAECEALERSTKDTSIAVCLRTSGKLIGDLFAEPQGDTFSVGWNFNPKFGGKGYACEAATALFSDLFTQRAARRLYAYVEDTNTSSQRLCEQLCMRREGVFMEYVSFQNDAHGSPIYENTMQYALLHREWLSHRSAVCSRPA